MREKEKVITPIKQRGGALSMRGVGDRRKKRARPWGAGFNA